MRVDDWLEYTCFANLLTCIFLMIAMSRNQLVRRFWQVAVFLILEVVSYAIAIPILFFRRYVIADVHTAYRIYFYSHWVLFVLEALCIIGILYNVYSQAMAPLKGLHKIGALLFRWIACISLLCSLALAVSPHFHIRKSAQTTFFDITERTLQAESILALCLLVFVCYAIKPLGLTFRSRIFGVSLGMGVFSVVQLIESAWSALFPVFSVYAPVYLFTAIGSLCVYAVWGVYFFLPEPERGMVMLPTTSPYFLWNAISEALGDDPGHVVVAGFTPQCMTSGELAVATAMSRAATERERRAQLGLPPRESRSLLRTSVSTLPAAQRTSSFPDTFRTTFSNTFQDEYDTIPVS